MVKLQFEGNKQYKITLPKALVEAIGWNKGDRLFLSLVDGTIQVRKDDRSIECE